MRGALVVVLDSASGMGVRGMCVRHLRDGGSAAGVFPGYPDRRVVEHGRAKHSQGSVRCLFCVAAFLSERYDDLSNAFFSAPGSAVG